MNGIVDDIKKISNKDMSEADVRMLNPLVLAYIGDTVYDLYVRTYLIMTRDLRPHSLHIESIKYVSAEAQARSLEDIMDLLEDDEKNIIRRGRNAKSGSIPKHADLIDYKHATGLEALLGYLYLLGKRERLMEIFEMILPN